MAENAATSAFFDITYCNQLPIDAPWRTHATSYVARRLNGSFGKVSPSVLPSDRTGRNLENR
jgi:hypothetical protein